MFMPGLDENLVRFKLAGDMVRSGIHELVFYKDKQVFLKRKAVRVSVDNFWWDLTTGLMPIHVFQEHQPVSAM